MVGIYNGHIHDYVSYIWHKQNFLWSNKEIWPEKQHEKQEEEEEEEVLVVSVILTSENSFISKKGRTMMDVVYFGSLSIYCHWLYSYYKLFQDLVKNEAII